MNPYRKLMNLIENAGEAMYIDTDRTKSVSLSRLPRDVAELLRNNPDTVGRFEFADEGDEWFSQATQDMSFIEAARRAAEEYARSNDTRFARLSVSRALIQD
jgi:hypothetical protein